MKMARRRHRKKNEGAVAGGPDLDAVEADAAPQLHGGEGGVAGNVFDGHGADFEGAHGRSWLARKKDGRRREGAPALPTREARGLR